MSHEVLPVVMCGGTGSRLWPLSRASMPKQFQAVIGEQTLLQQTATRVCGPGFAPPAFVAADPHRFLVGDQIEALGITRGPIILEPMPRNTAAVAVVASLVAERAGHELVLLLPSDHVIRNADAFRQLVLASVPAAAAGHVCLFGMEPDRPETGYGYIEVGAEGVPDPDSPVREVASFVEKPDRATAERLLAAGGHLWNSGIFLFSAETMLREAAEQRPELLRLARAAFEGARTDEAATLLDAEAFGQIEDISLDYAIMQNCRRAAVTRANLEWSDVGSWDAVHAFHHPDGDGNVMLGRGVAIDTRGSYIRSERQVVATLGLRDVIIVAGDDALLVADKSRAQDVKRLTELMRAKGFPEAEAHAEVHRPWGTYRSLIDGGRFQVKIITVKPGGRLSLQLHRHRAEHWVVVKGAAQITCGEEVFMLYENQSTYIPQGTVHRLENLGRIPLEMIEVQSGSYLGEDDIIRVEDVYGRT